MISQADIYGRKSPRRPTRKSICASRAFAAQRRLHCLISTLDARAVAGLHQRHQFDLITLDLVMPGMSGYEVIWMPAPAGAGRLPARAGDRRRPGRQLGGVEAGARDSSASPSLPWRCSRASATCSSASVHRAEPTTTPCSNARWASARPNCSAFAAPWTPPRTPFSLVDVVGMTLVDVNDGACRLLGYARNELLALAPGTFSIAAGPAAGRAAVRPGPLARK